MQKGHKMVKLKIASEKESPCGKYSPSYRVVVYQGHHLEVSAFEYLQLLADERFEIEEPHVQGK